METSHERLLSKNFQRLTYDFEVMTEIFNRFCTIQFQFILYRSVAQSEPHEPQEKSEPQNEPQSEPQRKTYSYQLYRVEKKTVIY